MIVASPMNELELRNLMYTAQLHPHGAFAIRYPRGRGVISDWRKPFAEIPLGKARTITHGKDIAILSAGHPGNFVVEATQRLIAENISIEHIDMRFVKPLDEECLHKVFKNFSQVITVEDGTITGGLGSAVLEFMSEHGYHCQVMRLGVPDRFIEQGTQQELYALCGFDAEGIYQAVKTVVKPNVLSKVS
jgi:1-deoxy-D-xylulose-5-phosphate synthase